jgi:hypothetical protein
LPVTVALLDAGNSEDFKLTMRACLPTKRI